LKRCSNVHPGLDALITTSSTSRSKDDGHAIPSAERIDRRSKRVTRERELHFPLLRLCLEERRQEQNANKEQTRSRHDGVEEK